MNQQDEQNIRTSYSPLEIAGLVALLLAGMAELIALAAWLGSFTGVM